MNDMNPSDIAKILYQRLEGAIITTPVLPDDGEEYELTLNLAQDDNDVGLGAYQVVNGAFLFHFSGNTTGNKQTAGQCGYNVPAGANPQYGKSQVKREWNHNIEFEFCYEVAGVTGARLVFLKLYMLEAVLSLLDAGLSPVVKTIFPVLSQSYQRGRRHSINKKMYVQTITFSTSAFRKDN